jgi:hypothetical protein
MWLSYAGRSLSWWAEKTVFGAASFFGSLA